MPCNWSMSLSKLPAHRSASLSLLIASVVTTAVVNRLFRVLWTKRSSLSNNSIPVQHSRPCFLSLRILNQTLCRRNHCSIRFSANTPCCCRLRSYGWLVYMPTREWEATAAAWSSGTAHPLRDVSRCEHYYYLTSALSLFPPLRNHRFEICPTSMTICSASLAKSLPVSF